MKKIITLVCIMLTLTSLSSAQNGLNFDGNNDIVQTPYMGVLGTADRTFEAWIFVSANAPASNLAILDYGLNAVGGRNTFSVSGSRGLSFISGGTNANIGTAANAVPVNQWVHVAFVLNNGTGYLYVNGVQMGTGSLTTVNTPANNGTVRIGQRVSGGSIPFQGSIDEVRIWDAAITASDIQTNMNTEFCGQQPNLQLYLKMNAGTAGGANTGITTAVDDSGNGHNGTLSNFALNGTNSNWITGAGLTTSGGTNTFATISASDCGNYTLPSGNSVTTSGTYMDTIPNTQCGDSILTVNVTIHNNTSSTSSLTACNSFLAPNGDTFTSSQIINYTVPNAAGCDSIITINLTVLNPSSSITETSCGDYISPSGMVVTTSQIFTDIIPSAAGCDSTITIDLTILNPSSSITETSCGDYISPSGMIVTTSQIFTDTIPSTAGCDSIITIDLTIVEIDTTVTANGWSILSEETNPNATYQWFDCTNGNLVLIPNSNTQEHFPTTSVGFFAVEISLNGCVDTSGCVAYIWDNTQNQYLQSAIRLYPNPTNGNFLIDLGEVYQDIQVEIYSVDGKIIANQTFNNQQQINTKIEAITGLYQVKIITEKGVANKMILKE